MSFVMLGFGAIVGAGCFDRVADKDIKMKQVNE